MHVRSPFPAHPQSAEAVQPGKGPLDHPPVNSQTRAVLGAAPRDSGHDAAGTNLLAVAVVVVAAVGVEGERSAAGPADPATNRRHGVEKRQELGDIVAVATRQDDGERGAVSVGDQVVLGAGPAPVDRRRARVAPPFNALTCEESTTQRDQSSFRSAFSSASKTSWSLCQTPASFQSRSRRQHVMPEPNPSSCGRYSHWIPVCSTNKIPHNACRSGTLGRPATNFGPGSGSNGSISDHSSSETTHGRDSLFPTNEATSNQADSHII